MSLVSGVIRSLRPLPWQATCAPAPRCRSARVRPVSSEIRSPVCTASSSRAWSRRPVQVLWSQAASRASTSGSVEVGDQCPVEAFGRDRQHPGDGLGVFGVGQRGVAEQRVDRGQPGVAGADAVAALGLEMVEEAGDQRCVEVGQVEPRRWNPGVLAA